MALLWIDGFEKYGDTLNSQTRPAYVMDYKYNAFYNDRIDVVPGRNSGNAIRIDNGSIQLCTPDLKTPGSTDNTLICGFAFSMSALNNTQRIVDFRDATDHGETIGWGQFYLTVNGGGAGSELNLYRGNTLLATSTTANLQVSTWYYLEMKVYSHDSTGTCNVRIDEQEVISFSGDTRHRTNNSQVTYSKILWRLSTSVENLHIDDLYICDGSGATNNDFLGDCQVATLSPSADVLTEWTQDFGANLYDRINETKQHAGNISESTSGNQALFELDNLTANQAALTVAGIMLNCESNQSARGMTQFAKAITQNGSGNTVEVGGDFMPGQDNPLTYTIIMEDDPDGNDWDAATVNQLRFGVELS